VGSPVGWHPVERALQVSAGVENIIANSTPKNDMFVTAKVGISDFKKREVDGFYLWQKGLTGFSQGLTRTVHRG